MADNFIYKTIQNSVENIEFKDRGSKFIGFCFSVDNPEQIKLLIKQLKELHPKANHHCYAYRLGLDKNNFRANDDGEPSKSAGYPILGQIDSMQLTNILVVVVRYFGGTLLGVPGLVNAYRTTAKLCLDAATIIEKETTRLMIIELDYTLQNDVQRVIKEYNILVQKREYGLFSKLWLSVFESTYSNVELKLRSIYGVTIVE